MYRLETTHWEVVRRDDPLLTTHWDQLSPFNQLLNPINGTLPPVGCAPVAVGQIMNYSRYPATYNWAVINGSNSRSAAVLETARLLRDLGLPEYLNVSYSLGGSGTLPREIPKTFSKLGYTASQLLDYDWNLVCSELMHKRPLHCGGLRAEPVVAGHAWVIDGFIEHKREIRKIFVPTGRTIWTRPQSSKGVHCNLGAGGRHDGYYSDALFSSRNASNLSEFLFPYSMTLITVRKP